jgi:hypothetical protein
LGRQVERIRSHGQTLLGRHFNQCYTPDITDIEQTELLSPNLDHLLVDLVFACGLGNRSAVGLPRDRDYLLFMESVLTDGFLASWA